MKWIATLVVGFALLVPSTAMATSTCQAYNPQTCTSVTTPSNGEPSNGEPSSPSSSAKSTGTLPFTGLDVALLVAGGGTLLLAGFGMRRLSRAD